ncbi:MAG TPA: hypothetical protein VNE41_01240 [Chitinophagaceae bacterium]|nr:hypothetical protein [Chitinophagaceae bacterium]
MIDSFYIRLVVVFAAVNGLGIAFYQAMHGWGISDGAGATGNFVLAAVSGISYYLNFQAIKSGSTHAFIRLVYLSMFTKLLVCIAGILIYVVGFREHMTRSTIILLMILYIVYSFLEVFSILQLSKTKHH